MKTSLINTITCEDCLTFLPKVPDQSVDMVLVDLPYGQTAAKWDQRIPMNDLWEQYARVAKPNAAIVFTAIQPFTSLLVTSKLDWFRHEWVWVKNTSTGMMLAGKAPMRRHESILVFSKKPPKFNPQMVLGSQTSQNHAKKGYTYKNKSSKLYNVEGGVPFVWSEMVNPHSVLPCDSVGNRDKSKVHPTQKPVPLMEYLIRTYTDKGGIVLDHCCGSGSTGVACVRTGRRFIMCDSDEGYVGHAKRRVKDAQRH